MIRDRRPRYLFVRVLEACDAGCFMCRFAHSTDHYRMPAGKLQDICREAAGAGFEFVHLTGGEPLAHPEICQLVEVVVGSGLRCSLITNGGWLPELVVTLADAGLEQVIVSLDGASAATHDRYRRSPGLYDRAVAGLLGATRRGLRTRVNTVVGPHNYTEMPALKGLLRDWEVHQWELSALKLERPARYNDRAHVLEIGVSVYDRSEAIVPMGIPWYGVTAEQQDRYFVEGIPPRPSGAVCHVTGSVVYLDPKNRTGFVCSCLPHRPAARPMAAHLDLDRPAGLFVDASLAAQRDYFAENGPRSCTGCSPALAAYSDAIEAGRPPSDWDC